MTEPNKANIRKWVEALRSGEYKQAASRLRVGESFCCLGVACDISAQGAWLGRFLYRTETTKSRATLPDEVLDWLGLDNSIPMVKADHRISGHDGLAPVSGLNDDRVDPWTFSQIADAIEATYLTEAGDPS